MNARKLVHLLLVGLMTLLTVTATLAAKPEFQLIEIDDPPTVITECGSFTVLVETQGRIKVSTHFDKNGDPVKEIARFHLVQTYTNSESGKSITLRSAGPDKTTFNADGSITVAVSGRGEIVTPDGELITFRGRVVINITEDGVETVVFQAGKSESLCLLLS